MSPFEPNQFHDPSLRRAVRSAWSHERAPAGLRASVRQLIRTAPIVLPGSNGHNGSLNHAQNESVYNHHTNGRAHAHEPLPSATSTPRWWSIRHHWHQLPAAAIILLCLGIIGYQVHSFYREFYPVPPSSFSSATILPQATIIQLVSKHDECIQLQDHHTINASRRNFDQIARALGHELGCQILAADLDSEGWRFNGASTCRIGNNTVSHLLFVSDEKSLSLYTLPTSPCGGTLPGRVEEAVFDQHFVAAFQKDGALHALVAYCPSGNIEMSEVTALRDRLRQQISGKTKPQ